MGYHCCLAPGHKGKCWSADSISVDMPRDPVKALRAVRESNGAFVLVEDSAILQAILPLARLGAVFAERPAPPLTPVCCKPITTDWCSQTKRWS